MANLFTKLKYASFMTFFLSMIIVIIEYFASRDWKDHLIRIETLHLIFLFQSDIGFQAYLRRCSLRDRFNRWWFKALFFITGVGTLFLQWTFNLAYFLFLIDGFTQNNVTMLESRFITGAY